MSRYYFGKNKMKKPLLKVPSDAKGIFKSRENRFLGKVEICQTSSIENVHIRDPGRLKDILYPGNEVLLERAESDNRKTDWTLLAGKVDRRWIFINSGYHRDISEGILDDLELTPFEKKYNYRAEKKLGNSRIDFLLDGDEKNIWLEIKGCTLARDGIALFPDAPTLRGKRHVEELTEEIDKGKNSGALLFLIFRSDAECFKPYKKRDPEFASAFKSALKKGLDVYTVKLEYDGNEIYYCGEIPLCKDI